MLPKRQERCDTDTLIWEYLDGQSSPSRVSQLEERITIRPEAREKFVENAMLHGLLREYFAQEACREAAPEEEEQAPRRKVRRSAA